MTKEKKVKIELLPVLPTRNMYPVDFYDRFMLCLLLLLFTGLADWSWWFILFFVVWARPFIILTHMATKLIDNARIIKDTKRISEEEIEKLNK